MQRTSSDSTKSQFDGIGLDVPWKSIPRLSEIRLRNDFNRLPKYYQPCPCSQQSFSATDHSLLTRPARHQASAFKEALLIKRISTGDRIIVTQSNSRVAMHQELQHGRDKPKKHSSMGCFRLWWPTDMGDALQDMHKPSHARFVSYLRPPSSKPPNTLGESRSNNRLEAVIRTKLRRFSENDYVCPSNRLLNPQNTI